MSLTYRKNIALLVLFLMTMIKLTAQQTLFIDKLEYSCANSFSTAIRTKNISNVVALQGTVSWDTAVVKYDNISFGNSNVLFTPSNVNVAATANGYLTFLWYDNNLQPKSAADSTALFTINFSANGSTKGTAFVNFSSTPTQLEIDTLLSNGLPSNNTAAVFSNGYIITPSAYKFIGNGNYDDATNWINSKLPPIDLPTCSEIIIDPQTAGECILNRPQNVLPGAKITVAEGKIFFIPGTLSIQ